MKWAIPEYAAAVFAFAMWVALAAMNISLAYVQGSLFWQIVGYVFFGVFDVCAVLFVPLVVKNYAADQHARTVVFAILWAACCLVEGLGAYSALRGYSIKATTPTIAAEENRKAAVADLEAEQANLTGIRTQMKTERKASLVDALQNREKASLERIAKLRPKTSVTSVDATQEWWVGYEAAVVFSLWVFCQMAVFGLTGTLHGGHHAQLSPVQIDITPRRETQTVLLNAEQDSERDRQRDTEVPIARQQAITNETGNETDGGPDSPSGGGQRADKTGKDTVSEQDKTQRDKPRLVAVPSLSGPAAQSKTANGTGNGEKRRETALTVLPKATRGDAEQDAFDRRVADLKKAGFSVRDIVSKLETTKSKVEASLKRSKKNTTASRA
jgi:hypothetical protein